MKREVDKMAAMMKEVGTDDDEDEEEESEESSKSETEEEETETETEQDTESETESESEPEVRKYCYFLAKDTTVLGGYLLVILSSL